MALMACSECGRAVSDKAAVCIGCGAPLTTSPSTVDLVAKRSNAPPPTRRQIKRRALLSLSMFALGLIWAVLLDHRPSSRLASFMAALLIIGGLCWLMVVLVHAASSRR
jgi:RNA polymerase subunit RPABC4/transcription elongation factor Spt4